MAEETKLHTLSVMLTNEAGVLSQVSRLFSRKGYNIESLAVGTVETTEFSRATIEVFGTDDQIKLLCNQLNKLYCVLSVKLLEPGKAVRRELVLIKVHTPDNDSKNTIIQIANIFRGTIIDVADTSLTVSMIGDETKIDALQELLAKHGILEMVRTGMVALERGSAVITEDTKVKGEFNYGKNVL